MLNVNKIKREATLTTLNARSGEAGNSFDEPEKYLPVNTMISNASKHFSIMLPPYSVSILRLKAQ